MAEWKKKASEAYLAKLRDPRWQKQRLEIFQRDNFTCQYCWDKKSTLHVHHLEYIRGKEPWEYDNSFLVTLCEGCHEFERERPEIERKLLRSLNFAKISAEQLDAIACPTPFGAANYNHFFRILSFVLNADLMYPPTTLAAIDNLKDRVQLLYDEMKKKTLNPGGEGDA